MGRARAPFQALIGASAYSSDNTRVGQVRSAIVDEVTGALEWVAVATGILGARQKIVPIASHDIQPDIQPDSHHDRHHDSIRETRVLLPFPASLILSAPRVTHPARQPTQAEEEALYQHYDMTTATFRPRPRPTEPGGPGEPANCPSAAPPEQQLVSNPALATVWFDPAWLDALVERLTHATDPAAERRDAAPTTRADHPSRHPPTPADNHQE